MIFPWDRSFWTLCAWFFRQKKKSFLPGFFCPRETIVVYVYTVFLSDMPFGKCGMDGWMDEQLAIWLIYICICIYISVNSTVPSMYGDWSMPFAWEISYRNKMQSQNSTFSLYFLHWSLPEWNRRFVGDVITHSCSFYCVDTCMMEINE